MYLLTQAEQGLISKMICIGKRSGDRTFLENITTTQVLHQHHCHQPKNKQNRCQDALLNLLCVIIVFCVDDTT
jgi:hypothetical protein